MSTILLRGQALSFLPLAALKSNSLTLLFAFTAFFLLFGLFPAKGEAGFFSRDTLPGYKHTIRGMVYLDENGNGERDGSEKGLPGIGVSDGLNVVKTGKTGEYLLSNAGKDAIFVFVHQPGNKRQSGQDFFHLLSREMDAGERFDFGLQPAGGSERDKANAMAGGVRFVQLSDSHIRNPSDRKYMEQATDEIYEMDTLPDFIVATGDLVDWGVDEHYKNYVAGMQEPPVPYFNVFGNHEIVFGPIERYHEYIGPDYYSFERGGILFLALNCVTPGERQDVWLGKTLKVLGKGRPVVIFQHFPPGLEDLERFKSMGVTSVFSGHWHSEKEMVHAGVQSINSPTFIMGGIDASPAGFKVVTLDAGGMAETGWRYGFQDKRLTIVSPSGDGSLNSGDFPIIVNAYDTSHEIASVTWLLKQGNIPLDSGELARVSATGWTGGLDSSGAGSNSGITLSGAIPSGKTSAGDATAGRDAPLQPGTYSFKVTVTDERGSSWAAVRQISVSAENAALPAPREDWPMFMGNSSHSGFTPAAIRLPLRLAWVKDTEGDPDFASPILAGGGLYLTLKKRTRGSLNGVTSFDPLTGERQWLFETPLPVNHSPAYAEGTLCIAEMGGRIYGLDAATGREKWSHDLIDEHGRYNYGAPAVYNGSFFAGVMRRLARLRPDDGRLEWEKQIGPSDNDWISSYSSPALGGGFLAMSGMFFAGEALTVVRADNGERIWGYNADNGMLGSITIAGDRLLFTSMKSILYAKRLSDGKDLWSRPLAEEGGDASWSATTPAVALSAEEAGIIVAGSGDGRMCGVGLADGKLLWTHVSGRAIYKMSPYRRDSRPLLSSPTIAGDKVFFGSADGHVYCLDLRSGKELWSYNIGVPVMSTPLVSGNTLYVAAYDGRLYAFTSGTGR